MVYTIIRKRNVFNQLANLPVDNPAITQALTKRGKKFVPAPTDSKESQILEGANHAVEAEPGTLKVSLADTPREFLSHFSIVNIFTKLNQMNGRSLYIESHVSFRKEVKVVYYFAYYMFAKTYVVVFSCYNRQAELLLLILLLSIVFLYSIALLSWHLF